MVDFGPAGYDFTFLGGLKETPIVPLRDAAAAIWEDPTVWAGQRPPGGSLHAILQDVEVSVSFADRYLEGQVGQPEGYDEHGLVRNEIAAIHLYTMSIRDEHSRIFGALNAALRGGQEKPQLVKPFFKWIRLLQHALLKLPPAPPSDIIFRAERRDDATTKKFLRRTHKERGVFPLWGFSSCTVDAEVAETDYFTTKSEPDPEAGRRLLYAINGGSSARDIQRYSAVPTDAEVLLPCAIGFKVKSVVGSDGGLLVMHLAQIASQKEQQGAN